MEMRFFISYFLRPCSCMQYTFSKVFGPNTFDLWLWRTNLEKSLCSTSV